MCQHHTHHGAPGRTPSDIVVVGGGFGGLVAAWALAQAGARVTVLEALHQPLEALRGELMHPPGVRSLDRLGLLQPLRDAGAVDVVGFAAYAGPHLDAVLLPYGHGPGLGLSHRVLVETLRAQVSAHPKVCIQTGVRVDDVLKDAHGRVVGVRGQDGTEFRAKWVVGADGRHSRVRRGLGVETETTLLSYSVAVTIERDDVLPHAGRGHVFVGGPGPILAYPFGRGRVRMNVDVPLEAPKGKEAMARFIADRYAAHVPEPLRGAMLEALATEPLLLCANHAIYTEACAAPGAALVGDAGGCSHPLTATGMTATLHDVEALAACFTEHGLTDDALLAYQQRRYRFVRAREVFTAALYEVLGGRGDGAQALRSGIFRYWREPRARAASMDILSGDESGTDAFVREYLKVVSAGGTGAALALWRARDRRAVRAVQSMLGIARHVTHDAVTKAIHTLAVERTPLLLPLPVQRDATPRAPTRRPAPSPPAEPPRAG